MSKPAAPASGALRLREIERSLFGDAVLRGGIPGESWVYLLGPGPIHVEKDGGQLERRDIRADYLRAVAEQTAKALRDAARRCPEGCTPWSFPVMRDHVAIGRREGDVIDARYARHGALEGLWALIRWTPGAWREIKGRKIQHVSLGVEPSWRDETGVTYGPILWEVSITTHPRAKGIGTIQDTLALQMSERAGRGSQDMDAEMMTALLEAFGERLDQMQTAITERLDALEAKIGETPATEDVVVDTVTEDDATTADAVELAEDGAGEEEAITASERKLLKALRASKAGKLNLNERSGGSTPAPKGIKLAEAGTLDLAKLREQTGLTGAKLIAHMRDLELRRSRG